MSLQTINWPVPDQTNIYEVRVKAYYNGWAQNPTVYVLPDPTVGTYQLEVASGTKLHYVVKAYYYSALMDGVTLKAGDLVGGLRTSPTNLRVVPFAVDGDWSQAEAFVLVIEGVVSDDTYPDNPSPNGEHILLWNGTDAWTHFYAPADPGIGFTLRISIAGAGLFYRSVVQEGRGALGGGVADLGDPVVLDLGGNAGWNTTGTAVVIP